MAQDNKRFVRTEMRTPVGTLKWPKLTEPDYGSNEYPIADGEYSTKIVFNEADPQFVKFRTIMSRHFDNAVENGEAKFKELKKPARDKLKEITVNQIFNPIYDEEENETGYVEMKVKMGAAGIVKNGPRKGKEWSRRPDIFDAFGRKIDVLKLAKAKKPLVIWGGTTAILAFEFDPEGFFIPGSGLTGLSLKLQAVQIIKLQQGAGKDASGYGFGTHADGYDATAETDEDEDEADVDQDTMEDTAAPAGDSDEFDDEIPF